jgi:hypothetical protein
LGVAARQFRDSLERALQGLTLRRPADPRLRAWQRYLEEQDGPGLGDELPEIVISETAVGIEPSALIKVRGLLELTDSDWDLARRGEIKAVGLKLDAPSLLASALTAA